MFTELSEKEAAFVWFSDSGLKFSLKLGSIHFSRTSQAVAQALGLRVCIAHHPLQTSQKQINPVLATELLILHNDAFVAPKEFYRTSSQFSHSL